MEHNISLRQGKVTKKYIESLGMKTLSNVLAWEPGYPASSDYWLFVLREHMFSVVTEETIKRLGKPNLNVKEYESFPGVWILDDLKSGINWLIWSDLHHRHPWKGTSFELVLPQYITDETMIDSLKRLVLFLIEK